MIGQNCPSQVERQNNRNRFLFVRFLLFCLSVSFSIFIFLFCFRSHPFQIKTFICLVLVIYLSCLLCCLALLVLSCLVVSCLAVFMFCFCVLFKTRQERKNKTTQMVRHNINTTRQGNYSERQDNTQHNARRVETRQDKIGHYNTTQ
jgi:predicted membrane protein